MLVFIANAVKHLLSQKQTLVHRRFNASCFSALSRSLALLSHLRHHCILYSTREFFFGRPLPFGGSPLEAYSRTSGESNHHRQSVSGAREAPYQLSHEDISCIPPENVQTTPDFHYPLILAGQSLGRKEQCSS